MKLTFKYTLFFVLITTLSFGTFAVNSKTSKTKKATTTKPVASNSKTSTINTTTSYVGWLAKKITGQHNGKVKLQEGSVITKDGVLVGGNFIIDMKTITCDDLTDVNYNDKLIGHLNSKDFFDVDGFSTSTIKITKVLKVTNKVNTYTLTADLTIKGITKSITFPATFKAVGKIFEGVAKITIDRTAFDIKYGSSNFFESLGDKAIKNDVEINVNIATN